MKKTIMLLGLVMLLSLAFANATVDSTAISPTGGEYKNAFPINFTITCGGNSTLTAGNDSSVIAMFNATLYHNVSGTWKSNYSLKNATPMGTTQFNFTEVNAFADSNAYTWGVKCANNQTGESTFSTNATFKVDTTSPTVARVTLPLNGTVIGNLNSVTNWTATTEVNFDKYTIQYSNATNFADVNIIRQQIITTQTTETQALTSTLPLENKLYYVRVLATDLAGNTAFEYVNVTVVVSAPIVTITSFSNNTYRSERTPNFEIVANHQFIDRCEFVLDGVLNKTNSSRTNGTQVFNASTTLSEGAHNYQFRCNNTGGNSSGFTANTTITIDTVAPTDFNCSNINGNANNTKSIDHVPEIRWNATADTNAGNFTVTVDNTAGLGSPEFVVNVSGTQFYTEVNLRGYNSTDRTWYIQVNATDLAGNKKAATNCAESNSFWNYRTDITNHYLPNGWNLVAIMESTTNASNLGLGLGVSWTTISRYNASKQFLNYNNGTSTNNGMVFRKGEVVFINVNANTYWENQTWDTSSAYNNEEYFNLTNTSGGWNVFGIQNQAGVDITKIERGIMDSNMCGVLLGANGCTYFQTLTGFTNITLPNNNSIQALVYFNNTASSNKKFVVHPFNYTKNNDTFADFGEVVWIQINASINGTSNLMIVNQTKIAVA